MIIKGSFPDLVAAHEPRRHRGMPQVLSELNSVVATQPLHAEPEALARDRVSRRQRRICLDVSDAFYRDVGALRDDAQSTDASLSARLDAFGEIRRHAESSVSRPVAAAEFSSSLSRQWL